MASPKLIHQNRASGYSKTHSSFLQPATCNLLSAICQLQSTLVEMAGIEPASKGPANTV